MLEFLYLTATRLNIKSSGPTTLLLSTFLVITTSDAEVNLGDMAGKARVLVQNINIT